MIADMAQSGRPRMNPLTHQKRELEREENMPREIQNARALEVLGRIKEKLTGRDFKKDRELDIEEQVDKLLCEATNLENLCQHYIGWCSFW